MFSKPNKKSQCRVQTMFTPIYVDLLSIQYRYSLCSSASSPLCPLSHIRINLSFYLNPTCLNDVFDSRCGNVWLLFNDQTYNGDKSNLATHSIWLLQNWRITMLIWFRFWNNVKKKKYKTNDFPIIKKSEWSGWNPPTIHILIRAYTLRNASRSIY